jgi:hypothetical protein
MDIHFDLTPEAFIIADFLSSRLRPFCSLPINANMNTVLLHYGNRFCPVISGENEALLPHDSHALALDI